MNNEWSINKSSDKKNVSCSPVAQLVEQTAVNRSVAGSSPARGAIPSIFARILT